MADARGPQKHQLINTVRLMPTGARSTLDRPGAPHLEYIKCGGGLKMGQERCTISKMFAPIMGKGQGGADIYISPVCIIERMAPTVGCKWFGANESFSGYRHYGS